MCYGFSKEDGSFENLQYMFWMRNKENIFQIRTLIWRPGTSQYKDQARDKASLL